MSVVNRNPAPLFSRDAIAKRVAEMGAAITADYRGRDLTVIGVLNGSFMFVADLLRAIDLPLRVEFLGLASYGSATESSGVVAITKDLAAPIEGADVLVVEDIVDTGLTMTYLEENLATRKPRSMKLAALLSKPSRRRAEIAIHYLGFTIEDRFVVGYGLDHDGLYRNLPYVGVVE